MCELLGLSSSKETTINLSLTVLAQRGESPHMHGDGWGIAFHAGKDVRLIKEEGPAKDSQWVEFIKAQEIRAHDIIAHIRKSTIGNVNYSNTHPFVRELYGRVHSFAHNGTLKGIFEDKHFSPRFFRPVGETDSELAFCVLMDRMKLLYEDQRGLPSLEDRLNVVKTFAEEVRRLGPANFLYSDGKAFFAHGDERHDPLTDRVSWPGLHYLQIAYDTDHRVHKKSFENSLTLEAKDDVITLFASVPLNDNNWVPLQKGEVIAVQRGHIISCTNFCRAVSLRRA